LPYRIDFFGDEIESIRSFDIENQLSKERIDQIRLISKENDTKASVPVLSYLTSADILCWHDADLAFSKVEKILRESQASPDSYLSEFKSLALRGGGSNTEPFQSERSMAFSFQVSPQPLFGLNID
jgi:hypothetical protein